MSTAGRWRISISLCCLHISISLWPHWLSNGYLIVELLDYSVVPCFSLMSNWFVIDFKIWLCLKFEKVQQDFGTPVKYRWYYVYKKHVTAKWNRFRSFKLYVVLLRGRISARVLTRTWAKGEASDVQAPFAGISYVVFGSWDLGKPLSSPT